MKVGRGRHLRVWFAAAPPGGPRSNPVGYYGPPGSGPRGTRKREKPVARWTGAYLLLASALARHTPSLWGNGKRDGPTPSPTKPGAGRALASLMSVMGVESGSARHICATTRCSQLGHRDGKRWADSDVPHLSGRDLNLGMRPP